MGASKLLILENNLGQKVRTWNTCSENLYIVYILDTRRVEAVADLQSLEDDKIKYQLLRQLLVSELTETGFVLEGLGRVRLQSLEGSVSSPTYELTKQNEDKKLTMILQRTALSHLAFVGVLIVSAWAVSYFASKEVETPLVTIAIPKIEAPIEKAQIRPHVQISQTKIKKTNKLYKPLVQKKIITKPFKVNTVKAVNVERVGALAALGGLSKGHKGSEGLDLNSLKNIRSAGTGQGGGGIGGAGRGGIKAYLPGGGLIAGSAGQGAQAQSAGGYGTRGTGGGKAGYGKISLVGGISAMSLPLDDEASVAGGLDPDQIIAVINRNKGEISYCYEKGLQAQPTTGSGRVAVDFVIGPNGRITTARISDTSLKSTLVENCIVTRMKTWQFPHPVGKVNVDVLYPFKLMRVSSR